MKCVHEGKDRKYPIKDVNGWGKPIIIYVCKRCLGKKKPLTKKEIKRWLQL
jgi:hypothetical protein